jgi:CubicO group peptidase (beta-lactamase class C family)
VNVALWWGVLLLVASAAAWGVVQLRSALLVGAAYKAKVLCTAHFGSRRALDPRSAAQVSADSYRSLRIFRAAVDADTRTVTASTLGFCERTAVYRDGLGATLVNGGHTPVDLPGRLRTIADPVPWRAVPSGAALRRLVDDVFEEPDPKRLRRTYAVVVVHDGCIVAERYAPGISPDMPLPGWSMTKAVIGTLVGLLADQGRLALDQRELMPEWRQPDPRAAITLEDLLRMRSGLRFTEWYGRPWSDVLHMLYRSHDASAYAASLPLADRPGATWSYSSGTTNILSGIIRRVVGDDMYRDWPHDALFGPLGMTSATLEPDGAGTFIGSSYMLATARDWARFGQLWLDAGCVGGRQLLSGEWVRFATTPTPQSEGRFGAHWWLKLNPEIGGDSPPARSIAHDAFFAIGHEGQTLTVMPSRRLVAVRLGASIYIDAWNQAAFAAALQDAL